jgi:hypothetical protein
VSFVAITLCVASQLVFIVVSVYFVIDSVRKLLDTPSYSQLTRLSGPAAVHRPPDEKHWYIIRAKVGSHGQKLNSCNNFWCIFQ